MTSLVDWFNVGLVVLYVDLSFLLVFLVLIGYLLLAPSVVARQQSASGVLFVILAAVASIVLGLSLGSEVVRGFRATLPTAQLAQTRLGGGSGGQLFALLVFLLVPCVVNSSMTGRLLGQLFGIRAVGTGMRRLVPMFIGCSIGLTIAWALGSDTGEVEFLDLSFSAFIGFFTALGWGLALVSLPRANLRNRLRRSRVEDRLWLLEEASEAGGEPSPAQRRELLQLRTQFLPLMREAE